MIRSFENRNVLFITDLHVGYDAEYRRRGLFLPLNSSTQLLKALLGEIERNEITHLIILGDFIHSFRHFRDKRIKHPHSSFARTPQYSRWLLSELKDFFAKLSELGVKSHLASGNHDIMLRKNEIKGLKIHDPRGFLFNNAGNDKIIGCAHGHVSPINLSDVDEVFLGHLHPAIVLLDDNLVRHRFSVFLHGEISRGKWLEILTKHGGEEGENQLRPVIKGVNESKLVKINILPSANPYMIGTPLNISNHFITISEKGTFYRHLLSSMDFDVFLEDYTYLGKLRDLRELYVEKIGIARQ